MDSDSASDNLFMNKKKRVQGDSNKENFIDNVYCDWLTNKEVENNAKNCFPLKNSVTVPFVHDDWILNLVDKSAR